MLMDELLDTICNPIPQLLARGLLDLLGQLVFPLNLVGFALPLRKGDIAHAQVRSTHVEGQNSSCFSAVWVAHHPSRVHGLYGVNAYSSLVYS